MDAPTLKMSGLTRLRKWAAQVTRAINANKVVSGLGVDVSEEATGRVINAILTAAAAALACHCEAVNITAKEPDCTGAKMKHYCTRALHYTRDGLTGFLSDRLALGWKDTEDPVCELVGAGIDWFFEPTAEQITAWLAAMAVPPTSFETYRVTLFFDCSRGVTPAMDDGKLVPCGAETSSRIVLVGICYGND